MDWNLKPARDLGLSTRERLASPLRERSLGSLAISAGWRWLVRLYLALSHRLRVIGRENLPRTAPFLLIANHASHLDALILTSVLRGPPARRVYVLAAADTFFTNIRQSAFAAYALNALPVTRQGDARAGMLAMRGRLREDGAVYVIFPEGTRTRTGTLGAFKAGMGMLVAGTNIQVVPCWIQGAFEAWPAHHKLPRPRPVKLLVGAPLRFPDAPDTAAGWRRVTEACEAAVRRLGQPVLE